MEAAKPWYEQDNFWETAGPVLYSQRRWANTPDEIDKIISLLKIEQGGHILDLCCGVGRHSLELARRGFRVMGVDRTQKYLEQASEQAEKEGLEIEFIQSDIRTFFRPDTFDAVINLFTSFGYFEDPEEDRRVALNIYHSLKPSGVFIIDIMGKEVLARIFTESNWYEEDGILVLQEHKVKNNWSWMDNRWIIIKDNKRTELGVTHRLYAATEMVSLLTGCGFTHVDIYGDLAGSPYDHKANRLIAVAYK